MQQSTPSLAQVRAAGERCLAQHIAANTAKLPDLLRGPRPTAGRDEVAAAHSRCPRHVGLCSNCGRIAATRPMTQRAKALNRCAIACGAGRLI